MYTGLLFPSEPLFFSILVLVTMGIAVLIFISLFFVTAAYGRHAQKNWGPNLDNRLGWVLMELPTVLIVGLCFLFSDKMTSVVHLVFFIIWNAHYFHRVFIYPFQIRNGKKMTLSVVLMGFVFNLSNAYIQGRWIFTLSDPEYAGRFIVPLSANYTSVSWLYSPQFIAGVLIFVIGYYLNKKSDLILRSLREPGETNSGYKIPQKGFFRFVSCPNYLGEMLEWIGWTVLTWSVAGLTFAVWTVANLLPRAISHHKWYKQKFDDYPEDRKAIIPFLL